VRSCRWLSSMATIRTVWSTERHENWPVGNVKGVGLSVVNFVSKLETHRGEQHGCEEAHLDPGFAKVGWYGNGVGCRPCSSMSKVISDVRRG
jgi:hypothetical protein